MTLQQLKYAIAVADTRNITEASKRVFISQPSLTAAIHELEEEMCREDILSDYLRLDALSKELEDSKEKLSKYYQKWLQ